MSILLRIDCREKELIAQLTEMIAIQPKYKSIQLAVEQLPIGDIILSSVADKTDFVVIERKTVSDLMSSLRDGRYNEQSFRLTESVTPNHNIFYLIEGSTSSEKMFHKMDKSTFYSCLFSLSYYKGFSIMQSSCISQSAFIICNMVLKMEKGINDKKQPFVSLSEPLNQEKNTEIVSEKEYIHVRKIAKKEHTTTNNIDEIMLAQIPGVSTTMAVAIIQKFGSVQNIIQTFHKENNNMTMFDDIYCVTANDKKRRLAKTAIQKIYNYLLKV